MTILPSEKPCASSRMNAENSRTIFAFPLVLFAFLWYTFVLSNAMLREDVFPPWTKSSATSGWPP